MPSLFVSLYLLWAFARSISAKGSSEDLTSLPRLVEVDLIFPRNDTYRPVFPFPLVVAVRGAAAALKHGLLVQLFVGTSTRSMDLSGSLEPKDFLELPSADPYYWILLDWHIINSTSPHWRFDWSLSLDPNCTATPDKPMAQNNYTSLDGSVYFTIDKQGKLPDIVPSVDSCPLPIASFNMTCPGSGYVPYRGPDNCFAYIDQLPDPCPVKATPSLESKVTMQAALCEGQDWPNNTQKFFCPRGSAHSTHIVSQALIITGLRCYGLSC